MELQIFISGMDTVHKRSAIVRIADVCHVSRCTVTRWIEKGTVKNPLYKKAINEEFRQEIFKL